MQRQERFFLIELLPGKRRGLVLALDRDRNLRIEQTLEDISSQKLSLWLKLFPKASVVVSAHPSLALTVTMPLALEREPELAKQAVNAAELENLLGQRVMKIFYDHRESMGRTLGVAGLDVVLVGAKIRNFTIEGDRVLNPVGFRGRTMQALLELTLTRRDVFDDWKDFWSRPTSFFFTEFPRAELVSLSKTTSLPLRLFVLEPRQTRLFMLESDNSGPRMYRGEFEWPIANITTAVADRYAVGEEIGAALYRNYLGDAISPALSRSLRETVFGALQSFRDLLREKNISGKIYIDTSSSVPFPSALKLDSVTLEEPDALSLFERLGFTLVNAERLPEVQRFRRLAPFIEFYYDRGDSSVNRWLKRRLHWLIT